MPSGAVCQTSSAPCTSEDCQIGAWGDILHMRHDSLRLIGDITTDTVGSIFAILMRALSDMFHHVRGKHLQRYTAEVAFR
ncbi:transposase [Acidithiobacillus caldus]|uniref:transposase n=2 Tax=Acidithiobacillus caldus TaxID=33059 RepID=UPI0009BCE56A|nr:transposase [Acidithiobacillus caldus]